MFFVDYGNTEISSLEKICSSFPPQFKSLPPQAVRCSLAGVRPVSFSSGIVHYGWITKMQCALILMLYWWCLSECHVIISIFASISRKNVCGITFLHMDTLVKHLKWACVRWPCLSNNDSLWISWVNFTTKFTFWMRAQNFIPKKKMISCFVSNNRV